MRPGMIQRPTSGTVSAPGGIVTESRGPTATICPPDSTSTAFSMTRPVPSTTVAPVYAVASDSGCEHAAIASRSKGVRPQERIRFMCVRAGTAIGVRPSVFRVFREVKKRILTVDNLERQGSQRKRKGAPRNELITAEHLHKRPKRQSQRVPNGCRRKTFALLCAASALLSDQSLLKLVGWRSAHSKA